MQSRMIASFRMTCSAIHYQARPCISSGTSHVLDRWKLKQGIGAVPHLILVERTKTSCKELACGTDRNDLALMAQCEFLHKSVLGPLIREGIARLDEETTLEIEEQPA